MKKFVFLLLVSIFSSCVKEEMPAPAIKEQKNTIYFSVSHGTDKETNFSFWGITLLTETEGVLKLKFQNGGEIYLPPMRKGEIHYYFEPNQFRVGDMLCFVVLEPVKDPENQICAQEVPVHKTENQ